MTTTTETFYGAFKLLDIELKETGMHVTAFFRHDATKKEVEQITMDFKEIDLFHRPVRIESIDYLDGSDGKKSQVKVCTLSILENNNNGDKIDENEMGKLKSFSNKHSYRRNLKEQYDYTMHVSIGIDDSNNEKNFSEFQKNTKIIDDIIKNHQSVALLGEKYIKNMDTKKIDIIE